MTIFEFDYIAGDCFLAGDDFENGDFKSLTDEEIESYTKEFKKRSYKWNDLNEVEL